MKTESQSLKQVQTVASAQPTTELALFVVALALPHPEAEATTFKQFQTRFQTISNKISPHIADIRRFFASR